MDRRECTRCDTTGLPRVELINEDTQEQVLLCVRCLRSSSRMKADVSDGRAEHLLADYATTNDCEVYHSAHVRYVLPSLRPDPSVRHRKAAPRRRTIHA